MWHMGVHIYVLGIFELFNITEHFHLDGQVSSEFVYLLQSIGGLAYKDKQENEHSAHVRRPHYGRACCIPGL